MQGGNLSSAVKFALKILVSVLQCGNVKIAASISVSIE
jgi:hypothetical protein